MLALVEMGDFRFFLMGNVSLDWIDSNYNDVYELIDSIKNGKWLTIRNDISISIGKIIYIKKINGVNENKK